MKYLIILCLFLSGCASSSAILKENTGTFVSVEIDEDSFPRLQEKLEECEQLCLEKFKTKCTAIHPQKNICYCE